MEVIYSSYNQNYDFWDEKTRQSGTWEAWSCKGALETVGEDELMELYNTHSLLIMFVHLQNVLNWNLGQILQIVP